MGSSVTQSVKRAGRRRRRHLRARRSAVDPRASFAHADAAAGDAHQLLHRRRRRARGGDRSGDAVRRRAGAARRVPRGRGHPARGGRAHASPRRPRRRRGAAGGAARRAGAGASRDGGARGGACAGFAHARRRRAARPGARAGCARCSRRATRRVTSASSTRRRARSSPATWWRRWGRSSSSPTTRGDMRQYLESLRLSARARSIGGATTLLPAHGPPIADGGARLDFYVAHRLEREARVAAALGDDAGDRGGAGAGGVSRCARRRSTRSPRARCWRTCTSWSTKAARAVDDDGRWSRS